jgi:hypothetical protein
MMIDESHRPWLIGSLIVLALGALLYVPYAFLSVSGVSGGSAPGLVYAGVGSAMMLFAGLLGVRKRFRIMRLGRATFWMRGHLWIGFLSFPFILFHAGFRLGSGALTEILMVLFLIVFISGIFGAVLQNFLPRVMTQRVPLETVFEQIDHVLEQLVEEAGGIISAINAAIEQEIEREESLNDLLQVPGSPKNAATATAADERTSKKISSFFDVQLKPYLTSRRSQKYLLANPVRSAGAFQQLKVLVPQDLWPKFDDLENICDEKRQLERQRRLHKFLHGWLLFHIPASYALLLLGAIHAVVALRY